MGDKEFLVLQKLPTSSCNVRCVFNEEDFCGGKNAVSLFYAVGSSILSADENSKGITGERAICLVFSCYIMQLLETSGGQFTFSTQLLKLNYLLYSPTDVAPYFI